jgi:hypothetical protein
MIGRCDFRCRRYAKFYIEFDFDTPEDGRLGMENVST